MLGPTLSERDLPRRIGTAGGASGADGLLADGSYDGRAELGLRVAFASQPLRSTRRG
jgi:hypothetical protein